MNLNYKDKVLVIIIFVIIIMTIFIENSYAANWVDYYNPYPGNYANKAKYQAIDVSHHNVLTGYPATPIDWNKVKNEGVDVAIIRIAGRNEYSGATYEDQCYDQNIKGAKDAGLKVGIYYFSSAINESEAEEDAIIACQLTKNIENKYNFKIDLPIYMDYEDTRRGCNAYISKCI